MRARARNNVSSHRGRRALTLVEATISVVIVGVLLVAALNTTGASLATRHKTADRRRGALLAQDLMSEILRQHYEDPEDGPGSFGLGMDEVGDGSRALWEDVDDYDGWCASPPQAKNGAELNNFDGWSRCVSVIWVLDSDLSGISMADTGVKKITVRVTRNDADVAQLVAVRTNTWPDVSEYYVGGDLGDGGSGKNNPPVAVMNAAPQFGPVPLTVIFRADGSYDPDGDPLDYSWDFGDGNTDEGIVVTHTYTSGGSHVATLTVSDGRGGTDDDTATIFTWDSP